MPLALDDGYTLPFETKTVLLDRDGRPIESVEATISGRYRPPVFAESQEYRYAMTHALTAEEQRRAMAAFLCARVVDWDVTIKEPGKERRRLGTTPDDVLRFMPDVYMSLILSEVTQWRPKPQGEAEGNS
jgi:hypothetical protein